MFQFGCELELEKNICTWSLYDALHKLTKDSLLKELPTLPESEVSKSDRHFLWMGLNFDEKELFIRNCWKYNP